MLKILKYKAKIAARRARVKVSKRFAGRSEVAVAKPRVNGKFVKKEEYARMVAQGLIQA